mgnify:CR=1 FL=1
MFAFDSQVAPASVTETLGNKMDIWLVSNLPVGLYRAADAAAEKTYFLRGHVLAGNAELAKFASLLEKVTVDTVEAGDMTKDLALLVGAEQKWLSTTGFLEKVSENMRKAMAA